LSTLDNKAMAVNMYTSFNNTILYEACHDNSWYYLKSYWLYRILMLRTQCM